MNKIFYNDFSRYEGIYAKVEYIGSCEIRLGPII